MHLSQIERVKALVGACEANPKTSARNLRKARKWLARLQERRRVLGATLEAHYRMGPVTGEYGWAAHIRRLVALGTTLGKLHGEVIPKIDSWYVDEPEGSPQSAR